MLSIVDSSLIMSHTSDSTPQASATSITVEVLVFAKLAELLGRTSLQLTLPAPATVGDVRDAVLASDPRLKGLSTALAFAVNRAHTTADAPVDDGDEVALLPPLAGG
jgi:molybdopterin synthase sulfur carrier subunit